MIFLIATISWAANSDEIKIQERELEKLEQRLGEVNNDIVRKEDQNQQLLNEIQSIENQIRSLDGEIENIENRIVQTKADISETENELVIAEESLQNNQELLNQRLKIMYKSREIGYLEVLLGSEDFKDLMTRIDMVQKIFQHDTELIEEVKSDIKKIEDAKAKLEEQKSSLEASKVELEEKKSRLVSVNNDLVRKQNELKNNIATLEALEDKLLEDAEEVKRIIENLKLKEKYVGGVMTWPTPGNYKITSYFGNRIHPIYHTKKMHTGIDISVPWGDNIVAAQKGTVIYANWLGGYGKAVMIDHGGGYVTLYGHNSSLNVKVGQEVDKGQVVAKCGTTGVSTGPHLHFEVMINGEHTDPMEYLQQ